MTAIADAVCYECEGCGCTIWAIGAMNVPKHGFCGICAWLCEEVTDPHEMELARKRLNLPHMGKEYRHAHSKL